MCHSHNYRKLQFTDLPYRPPTVQGGHIWLSHPRIEFLFEVSESLRLLQKSNCSLYVQFVSDYYRLGKH